LHRRVDSGYIEYSMCPVDRNEWLKRHGKLAEFCVSAKFGRLMLDREPREVATGCQRRQTYP